MATSSGNVAMADARLRANYDDIVDVLYLTVGQGRPHTYEEDENGLVWRYTDSGRTFGVTIFDFKEFWLPRSDVLARQIATRLQVLESDAKEALRS